MGHCFYTWSRKFSIGAQGGEGLTSSSESGDEEVEIEVATTLPTPEPTPTTENMHRSDSVHDLPIMDKEEIQGWRKLPIPKDLVYPYPNMITQTFENDEWYIVGYLTDACPISGLDLSNFERCIVSIQDVETDFLVYHDSVAPVQVSTSSS